MAITRGPNREDRLALDMVTVTADASLVESPCFVYAIWVKLLDTNTTGTVSIADSTASGGDADKEAAKIEVAMGAGGVSAAGSATAYYPLPKPWHVRKTLVADVTGVSVTVLYLPVG